MIGITFILSMQWGLGIENSYIRSQCDYLFLYTERNMSTRRKLWKQYFKLIPDYHIFNLLYDEICGNMWNHQCMVLDNTGYRGNPHNLSNYIYWYKAHDNEDRGNWKFGSKKYWRFAERHSSRNPNALNTND